jgi:hypothetical protein
MVNAPGGESRVPMQRIESISVVVAGPPVYRSDKVDFRCYTRARVGDFSWEFPADPG